MTSKAALILALALIGAAAAPGETWRFTAQRVSSVQSESESLTVLDGAARVESDTMVILADHLELAGPDYDRISGFGSVSVDDRDEGLQVRSGRFEYDRDSDIIRFRDQVTLVDEGEGIVIRCESLDLLNQDDLAVMQISVRLIQEDTVCRGEYATFQRNENLLEISGRPVVWRDGDEYRADRIRVDLDTDEIVMEGTVAGALTTDDDQEDE